MSERDVYIQGWMEGGMCEKSENVSTSHDDGVCVGWGSHHVWSSRSIEMMMTIM